MNCFNVATHRAMAYSTMQTLTLSCREIALSDTTELILGNLLVYKLHIYSMLTTAILTITLIGNQLLLWLLSLLYSDHRLCSLSKGNTSSFSKEHIVVNLHNLI
ncbi:MAG: hypothetical protein HNEKOMLI_00170 [Sodalis sp. Psp]|nr:hypothetical protein [Sodalis sp. Psp]MCR3756667.1 hypothetical protein [Sodalis sp. Ppy]